MGSRELISRLQEAAEPKRGAFFIDLIAGHVDGSKLADLQRSRKERDLYHRGEGSQHRLSSWAFDHPAARPTIELN